MMLKKTLSLLLLIVSAAGCASRTDSRPSAPMALSAEEAQEIAIGQQIHATILSNFSPYTDPKVTGYIENIGYALAARAERRELAYHFTVLYSDKIYATSSPGGFVYLTTGMLHFIDNESELAAVLAHEIAQLQYKDPKNTHAKEVLNNITKGGAMVGPAFGPFGALASLGLLTVNHVSQPHALSLDKRLANADKKAIHYMMEADQDPQGMVDLLYKFLKADNKTVPYFYDYYQARPITQERFDALNKNFSKLPLEGKSFETNRDGYQQAMRGVHEIYKQ